EMMFEMLDDSAAVAHAARSHHDAWTPPVTQFATLLHRTDVMDDLIIEKVGQAVTGDSVGEFLRGTTRDLGDARGERAVHEHRQRRQPTLAHPQAKVVDHDLGSAQAEGRDEHPAALLGAAAHHTRDDLGHALKWFMDAAAVGTLAEKQV